MGLNCKQISQKLGSIKAHKIEFDQLLSDFLGEKSDEKVRQLEELCKQIEVEIKEIELQTDPSKIMMAELNDEKNWQLLSEEVQRNPDSIGTAPENDYEMIEKIFGNFDSPIKLNNISYQKFADELINNEKINFQNTSYKLILNRYNHGFELRHYLNSLFLNKFMDDNTTLDANDSRLPAFLLIKFASFLQRGKINLNRASAGTGDFQEGGVINIKKAPTRVGIGSSGGKINIVDDDVSEQGYKCLNSIRHIKNEYANSVGEKSSMSIFLLDYCGGTLAENAQSGIFIARESERNIGEGASSMVTILLDETEESLEELSGKAAKIILHYDDNNKYFRITQDNTEPLEPAPEITDDGQLLEAKKIESGLYVIPSLENITMPITEGLNNVILVLKQTPLKDIGKGMKQAVVIIEDPNITPDEARKRISREDREGGMILMRVPDPEDPDKTKLIDLEDDFIEKMEQSE